MDINKIGLGWLLGGMSPCKGTAEAVKGSLGKVIEKVTLDDDRIRLYFTDKTGLELWDSCQNCCEVRHTSTDDEMDMIVGQTLVNVEIAEGPSTISLYGEDHDTQFLRIKTDKDVMTFVNHNEHNGHCGGFTISARLMEPRDG